MEKKECILEEVTEAEWSSTDLPLAGGEKEGGPARNHRNWNLES